MIIKSMSRKTKSFSQLYDYLMRDKSNFSFTRNTYSNSKNKKDLINEFLKNAKYLNSSRGKVYLYHELLSLENNNLSLEKQKEILLNLANKYLEVRANEHLGFGVIHEDKNHVHLHLMISSNEIENDKRVRLSKREFSLIQKHIENFKNQKYKELSNSTFYQNKKDLSKEKQNEQELKNRGQKSIKDKIKEDLKNTLEKSTSNTYFENHLNSMGYKIYTRGNSQGITYQNKNYRLKTLGLENEYKSMFKKFEQKSEREVRRQKSKENKSYTKEQARSR